MEEKKEDKGGCRNCATKCLSNIYTNIYIYRSKEYYVKSIRKKMQASNKLLMAKKRDKGERK